MSRRIVGPFNRVEGDLEVQLEIAGDRVESARVVSPLYRGFEQILHGKDPRDALVYAPRICGICSVSQSVAAASALAAAQGITPPPNGRLAQNLVLACENAADHLTHFYLFFMPDFARGVYRGEPWYDAVAERFRAVSGRAARTVLPARAQLLHMMGLLAGKWPHSLAIQPGGSTRPVAAQEKSRLLATLFGFRQFLEGELYGAPLEQIVELQSASALEDWADQREPESSDLCRFLQISQLLRLEHLGLVGGRYISYGAYPGDTGLHYRRGVFVDGSVRLLDAAQIREDISHSWMQQGSPPRHPWEGVTLPDADATDGYSWCKAPRLGGQVAEVGALARQLVDGHLLIRDLLDHGRGSVHARVVARLLELARLQLAMESWVAALQPGEGFCVQAPLPDESQGAGLVEAARGSLGHWLRIRNGRIVNYQIIAPTTWNFSPRDAEGQPGPLEQALVGAPIRRGEEEPVSVQHIVRSFDPCMVCTVH